MKKALKYLFAYFANSLFMLGVAIIATAMFQQDKGVMIDGSLLGVFLLCQGAMVTILQTLLDNGE